MSEITKFETSKVRILENAKSLAESYLKNRKSFSTNQKTKLLRQLAKLCYSTKFIDSKVKRLKRTQNSSLKKRIRGK